MSTTTLEKDEIERIFFGFTIQAQKKLEDQLKQPSHRVIVLSGATGVGKSQFSLDLAKNLGGEIISADSMQVYRGMDIGTAKLSTKEMQGITHHLIDVRNVKDIYNVVDFYYEARNACQSILARNKVPIIVGGTGFYIHSFIYGPPTGPPSVPEVRCFFEKEMERLGPEIMYEHLKELDPEYAASITKHDKQKIIRSLEIIQLTGDKVSSLSWGDRKTHQNYQFHCWLLNRPRDELYSKIEKRCDEMVQLGLLKEVDELIKEGLLDNSSASQAIGYRQAIDYLKSSKKEEDYQFFIEKFKQATRNYAKRQLTWFRREPSFRWLDLSLHDYEVALELVIRDYERL